MALAALTGPDINVTGGDGFAWTKWAGAVLLKASLWLAAGMIPIMVGRKLWAESKHSCATNS